MQNKEVGKVFDLVERTSLFGEKIITFSQKIPKTVVTLPLINQLVKAGTSIGANYCEADCAESRNDYIHKVGICKKEARETEYWLRMIALTVNNESIKELSSEAKQLRLIFVSLINKSKQNQN